MRNCKLCPTKPIEEFIETLWACEACDEWIVKMEAMRNLDEERMTVYAGCEISLEEGKVKNN